MALNLFNGGYLPLEQRSLAENALLGDLHQAAASSSQPMDEVPEDLQGLDDTLSDTYFCNFSLFQSIPDSWAIKQLFPGDADPSPEREADAATPCSATSPATRTASSISSSIAATSRRTLPLHPFTGEPYYLGVFLVGAYQEILGDLHNLFGDTHAVHVSLDENGNVVLDARDQGRHGARGARLRRVRRRHAGRQAARPTSKRPCAKAGSDYEEAGRLLRFYEDGLHGYTYLEDPSSE